MPNYLYFLKRRNYLFWYTMKPKYLIFFPIRRDITSFPLQACTQPCLTATMEKHSHSLWPDVFMTQIPLCPPNAQATDSAQDQPDQCNLSLLSKTNSPWKSYRPRLFGQSWWKYSFSENLAYKNNLEYFESSVYFPAQELCNLKALRFNGLRIQIRRWVTCV